MVSPLFPTPHSVGHITPAAVSNNALGQPIPAAGAATVRKVYGWRVKATAEGASAPYAGRTVTELYLLTPDGDYAPADLVQVPADTGPIFEVIGDGEDFNNGPFGFTPGYRFTLRRVADGAA